MTYGSSAESSPSSSSTSRGLGYYLLFSSADQFLTQRVFASIAVSAGLRRGTFLVVMLAERLAVPWHRAER